MLVVINMAIGLLATIAALCNAAPSEQTEFGVLRETTRLLPEKLVALLDELRIGGYIRYEENSTGNPYGILRLTESGKSWIATFGDEVKQFVENAPASYRISSPERSTRRGGKRAPQLPPSPAEAGA